MIPSQCSFLIIFLFSKQLSAKDKQDPNSDGSPEDYHLPGEERGVQRQRDGVEEEEEEEERGQKEEEEKLLRLSKKRQEWFVERVNIGCKKKSVKSIDRFIRSIKEIAEKFGKVGRQKILSLLTPLKEVLKVRC